MTGLINWWFSNAGLLLHALFLLPVFPVRSGEMDWWPALKMSTLGKAVSQSQLLAVTPPALSAVPAAAIYYPKSSKITTPCGFGGGGGWGGSHSFLNSHTNK